MHAATNQATEPSHFDYHEDGMGGSITILQPGNDVEPLRFRMVIPPKFGPPAPECHPGIREDFTVIDGTLDLGSVNGKRVRLSAGEKFTLPPGVLHKPGNLEASNLTIECVLTPGRDLAPMFRSLYTATREHKGLSQFVRQAIVFRRHGGSISFPLPVRFVMSLVASVGAWLGVRTP